MVVIVVVVVIMVVSMIMGMVVTLVVGMGVIGGNFFDGGGHLEDESMERVSRYCNMDQEGRKNGGKMGDSEQVT